ncbi:MULTISPECIES: MFS transporter [unclassified Streptomyces]|uniref:MFS transporter n=1 Tax=unclassified Streptomyces TaxID=2593676 RepID=UPI0036E48D69
MPRRLTGWSKTRTSDFGESATVASAAGLVNSRVACADAGAAVPSSRARTNPLVGAAGGVACPRGHAAAPPGVRGRRRLPDRCGRSVGGRTGTVFAPLTATLAEHLSWRTTYTVLALLLALVTIPAHALALRAPWPPAPRPSSRRDAHSGPVARSRPFLMLATALTLNSFAMYAVVIALVPLLIARGASPTAAAWALGLGGAGRTLGRTLYATLARHTGVTTRTVTLIALGGGTTATFAAISGPFPLLLGIAIAAGMVRGNLTLLQATAVTDRWGTAQYGRLSGLLAAPATIASALAPLAGAALAGPLGGYPALFAMLALASTAAALMALGSRQR